jgi:hypothetical protein
MVQTIGCATQHLRRWAANRSEMLRWWSKQSPATSKAHLRLPLYKAQEAQGRHQTFHDCIDKDVRVCHTIGAIWPLPSIRKAISILAASGLVRLAEDSQNMSLWTWNGSTISFADPMLPLENMRSLTHLSLNLGAQKTRCFDFSVQCC